MIFLKINPKSRLKLSGLRFTIKSSLKAGSIKSWIILNESSLTSLATS